MARLPKKTRDAITTAFTIPDWLPAPNEPGANYFGWSEKARAPWSDEELALVRAGSGEPLEVLLAVLKQPDIKIDTTGDGMNVSGDGWRVFMAAVLELRARNVDAAMRAEIESLTHTIEKAKKQLERLSEKLPHEMRRELRV